MYWCLFVHSVNSLYWWRFEIFQLSSLVLLFLFPVMCLPSLSCGTSVLQIFNCLTSPNQVTHYMGLYRAGLGSWGISSLVISMVFLLAVSLILTEHFASKWSWPFSAWREWLVLRRFGLKWIVASSWHPGKGRRECSLQGWLISDGPTLTVGRLLNIFPAWITVFGQFCT